MRLGDLLNDDRVNTLRVEPNAYAIGMKAKGKENKVSSQEINKVIFPEPYENASQYYNRHDFSKPPPPSTEEHNQCNNHAPLQKPMFDIKSLLPMLMNGSFNDMLKPLISMLGGVNTGTGSGGIGDISKIFELFKPKPKPKKEEKEEEFSSKFDDMIIIED